MPTLNKDLQYQELYQIIRDRNSIDFVAKRKDLKFEEIEDKFDNINFYIPFRFPFLQDVHSIIQILLHDAIGKISIDPFDKVKLSVKALEGEIFYQKIDNGDEWRVLITF